MKWWYLIIASGSIVNAKKRGEREHPNWSLLFKPEIFGNHSEVPLLHLEIL